MNPERVLYHIDNQVLDRINLGQRWHDIIDYLSSNIKRYKKRDAYIQVSEKYLINNSGFVFKNNHNFLHSNLLYLKLYLCIFSILFIIILNKILKFISFFKLF